MIEPIMYIGIGFLVAGLLVIGVIPLVHARAVRLTMRRLEALTPLSMAEIQADKDQLRAEFAMSMSRLEMNVEQMKAKTTNQLAEIGKKSEAIGRLKFELGEKTAALFALEAKEKQLTDDVRALENELAARTATLEETEGALAATQAELAQITANFNESSVSSDSQRVELVALRAQAELLKDQVESYENETKELRDRLSSKTAEVEAARQQLAEERGRAEQLGNRSGRTRSPAHGADHGSGGFGAPRPGAHHPARRAGPVPDGLRERGRPVARPGDERAEERVRGSRRARRDGRPPPPRGRYRDHREVADRERAQAVPGRTRQAAARDRAR